MLTLAVAVGATDHPGNLRRILSEIAYEVPVPHCAARRPVVDAQPPAVESLWRQCRSLRDVDIARREVAQREDGNRDQGSIPGGNPHHVLRHRALAAVHGGILRGAPEHLVPIAPDPAQRHAVRFDIAGSDRRKADVVRTGKGDHGRSQRCLAGVLTRLRDEGNASQAAGCLQQRTTRQGRHIFLTFRAGRQRPGSSLIRRFRTAATSAGLNPNGPAALLWAMAPLRSITYSRSGHPV